MVKDYYRLTKPGIVYGNLMYAAAGFLLASGRHIDFKLMLAVLAGTALVIASACVFNNILDRNIDARMRRTKERAIVTQKISVRAARVYGTALGAAGFMVLAVWVNWLTFLIEAVGMVFYVLVYGYAKRKTVHSTIIGSISGSVPPVAGYCAVTNQLDAGALWLFLILTFWQMPHFYAIGIYRLKEYRAAKLPILTVKKGVLAAKKQIVVYIWLFIVAVTMLWLSGYAGYSYLVIVGALSLYWLWLAIKGFSTPDDNKWARKVFGFSLVITIAFSLMLALNAWLP